MLTYNIMIEGRNKTCEINKKPESPTPKKGDVLYGHIESTAYGDKFKSEQRPQSGGQTGGQSTSWTPRDDSHIRAQWAIGQSIQMHIAEGVPGQRSEPGDIEDLAKILFAMVDRVKAGTTEQEEPLPEFPGDEPEENNYSDGIPF
jgi:hypothetical protein